MIDKFRKNAAHGKQPFGIGTVSAIDPDQVRRDRMKLRENGFSPIPNYDKTTLLKGWPRVEITGEVIGEWARKHGRWLATGLRIENGLVAVDLDVDDGPMVERLAVVLQDIVPELADERVPWLERSSGRAKVAWFFRTDEAFGRLYTRRWLKPGETAEADATQFVEIFGGASARQFGAFGPHTRLDNGEVTRWYARHGGGAFSGKDATKVDRSGAYAARQLARDVVARGWAKACEVRVAYAIGLAAPIDVSFETFGTSDGAEPALLYRNEGIDVRDLMRPRSILARLDLQRPVFRDTAAFGHFGRSGFAWEQPVSLMKQQ